LEWLWQQFANVRALKRTCGRSPAAEQNRRVFVDRGANSCGNVGAGRLSNSEQPLCDLAALLGP
jgi:hypothetical protein